MRASEEQIKNGMSLGEEQQLYWDKEDFSNEETPIELYVKRNGEIIKFIKYEELEKLYKRINKALEILDIYGTSNYETADLLYSALRGK